MKSDFVGEAVDVLADTDLIFLDGSYLYATVKAGATPLRTLVPPCVYCPPEKVFIERAESDWPGVITYSYGASKTAYFPWNIVSLYYRHSSPGHEKAFQGVFQDLCDGHRQVITTAHPQIEINLIRSSKGEICVEPGKFLRTPLHGFL